ETETIRAELLTIGLGCGSFGLTAPPHRSCDHVKFPAIWALLQSRYCWRIPFAWARAYAVTICTISLLPLVRFLRVPSAPSRPTGSRSHRPRRPRCFPPRQPLPPAPRRTRHDLPRRRFRRAVSPQRATRLRALAAGPDHRPAVPRGPLRPLSGGGRPRPHRLEVPARPRADRPGHRRL